MIQFLKYKFIDCKDKAHATLNDLLQNTTEYFFCDTEFIRFKDSLPILQLLQITYASSTHQTEPKIYIFDCQEVEIQGALKHFFTNQRKTFVFHSVRQDLEGIINTFDLLPYAFFDLQIAASFLGFGLSIGLSEMAEHYLNISIDKSLQHSRWNNRPLSKKQIQYAAKDVDLIRQIFPKIQSELQNLGRTKWCIEFHLEYAKNIKNILFHENEETPPVRLDVKRRQKFFDLKKSIKKIADNLSIPLSILAPNEMIQSFVIDGMNQDHPFYQSWRKEVLKDLFPAELSNFSIST